ncbi:hypothetical protein MOQ72_41405 [Saccharopolyspora sp. K220]|uniref:hypothetical protein n=1 Tax=Saccharopolyspora soli TaxID=2926618 RepID=UPI001F5644F7|nr:hypothetical protein [Saccharopolyspora soli]MCI2423878.1 hypothetical protein [Saccharopolyspora soli]
MAEVRLVWTEVLKAVATRNRPTQALLLNATVQDLNGSTLVLSMPPWLVKQLAQRRRLDFVRDALRKVLGGEWDVQCVEAARCRPVTTSIEAGAADGDAAAQLDAQFVWDEQAAVAGAAIGSEENDTDGGQR